MPARNVLCLGQPSNSFSQYSGVCSMLKRHSFCPPSDPEPYGPLRKRCCARCDFLFLSNSDAVSVISQSQQSKQNQLTKCVISIRVSFSFSDSISLQNLGEINMMRLGRNKPRRTPINC